MGDEHEMAGGSGGRRLSGDSTEKILRGGVATEIELVSKRNVTEGSLVSPRVEGVGPSRS